VLIIRGIGPDAVYYYTGGREGTDPGRWWGEGAAVLDRAGPVGAGDLRRVLQGRHPGDGRYLPDKRPARRRAGWDLVFSAPKSVSLLWALQPDAGSIAAAHRRSVEGVMRHLEASMLTLKRAAAPEGCEPARGAVAAVFDHRANAASEPHLHTHVLLANLGQGEDGHWGAVSGSHWRMCREGLFALYQLELRHHLTEAGMDLPWRIRPDGTADLADIPRAAIRATSTQRWSATAVGRFETRRRATPQPWRERSAQSGFAGADALVAARRGERAPGRGDDDLSRAVSERLLAQRSDFRTADVWKALAACHPGGMTAAETARWSDAFCREATPVTTGRSSPRWTTPMAEAADERLLRDCVWQPTRSNAGPRIAASVAREAGLAEGAAEALLRLTTSERPLEIVGAPAGVSGLLDRAELIGAGMSAWERAGLQVAISCRRPEDGLRWQTLIGIEPFRRGRPVDVLVVDQADRRTTSELLPVMAAAGAAGARVVLVEGGTLPRLSDPASRALMDLAARLLPIELGALAPGPGPGLRPVRELIAEWARRSGPKATLVGLGFDEVEGLNLAARAVRREQGVLGGPAVVAAGRQLQPGDRVTSLRAGRSLPPRGTFGTVADVLGVPCRVGVDWDGGTVSSVPPAELKYLGYGYAATPAIAARSRAPLLLLGPESAVPALAGRVIGSGRAGAGLVPGAVAPERDIGVRKGSVLGL
jgi:conjugative relaxase-like TrwC/TraI family protein